MTERKGILDTLSESLQRYLDTSEQVGETPKITGTEVLLEQIRGKYPNMEEAYKAIRENRERLAEE